MTATTKPSSSVQVSPALVASALMACTSLRLSQELGRTSGLAGATAIGVAAVLVLVVVPQLAVRHPSGR